MRKKIFLVVEAAENNPMSCFYDVFMMITIALSIVPLFFKQTYAFFIYIDYTTTAIFIIDYILRLLTADFKIKKGNISFLIYPFLPMSIIDLISILPTFLTIGRALRILKVIRLLRTFKVFRSFKLIRYSKSIKIIISVLKKQEKPLLTVVLFAIGYILISALIIFNVEPDTFDDFFSAVYWATVSLTTVGYGDIYPVSSIGRVVTMISSILGIAIIALPSGIITAGFMVELNNLYSKKEDLTDDINTDRKEENQSNSPKDITE